MKNEIGSRIAKALDTVARGGDVGARPDATAASGGAAVTRVTLPKPAIDRPKKPEHGDFATNVALAAAKALGAKPLDVARAIQAQLSTDPLFERVDVAGPGFINLKLAPRAFHVALERILEAGAAYGRAPAATGERINLEFVSANPTGPLHMAHGRGAVTGDVIGRLLEAAGHRVIREYYVNDAGNQIRLLTDSVIARAKGEPVPEGGYGGEYVTELATWLNEHRPELVRPSTIGGGPALAREATGALLVALMLAGYGASGGIRQTLRRLGIHFDVWASEAKLHADGQVERSLDALHANGWLRNEAGALFFESSRGGKDAGGDDKDRVLKKSDGSHTYFASDIAYHKDKIDRGFDRLIDVWGADHHGYIARVRAALRALGLPEERFEVILVQMVSLLKNGEPYRMGKRLGNFITIDEVLEEIDAATGRPGAGRDALRYYFVARRTDAQLDIDVEIAKKQSLDNPVYYIQYGHARLCAILRKAREECGIDAERALLSDDLTPIVHADELSTIAVLSEWPEVVAQAAAAREPHRIVGYLTNLAQTFQSYYTRLKNEGDTILPRTGERQDGSWRTRDEGRFADKVRARVAWVRGIRDVYASGLGILGVTAPERMVRAEVTTGAVQLERTADTTTAPEGSDIREIDEIE